LASWSPREPGTVAAIPHQYLGLLELQKLTGLKELFDTLVVFENFPVDLEAEKQPSGVRLMDLNVEGTAHYPLIAIVSPGRQLRVSFDYHPNHFSANVVERLSGAFVRLLTAYATDPEQPVGGINLLESHIGEQLPTVIRNLSAESDFRRKYRARLPNAGVDSC